MRFLSLLLILLAWPCAAMADMRATWLNASDGTRWIAEVADNGDARFEQEGQSFFMLRSGGDTHVVYTNTPVGTRVVRVQDLQQVMIEHGVSYRQKPGLLSGSLVRQGETVVAGRRGEAHYLETQGRLIKTRPALVVSHDPAIAPLGTLLGEQMDFSIATIRISGGEPPANFLLIRQLVDGGVPLLLAGYSLEAIKMARIPTDRFRLPAEPLTLDTLRTQNGLPSPAAQ